jgi:WD40 repeat protein
MSGTQFIGGGGVGNPGPSWHIKGTGDFYGDGRTDILWQNDDGTVAIWNLNGTQFVGGGLVADPGPAWHVKATGDFNNDAHTDIVLQKDDGTVVVWNMDGTAFIGGGLVGSPGRSWNVFDDPMRFISSTSANETLTAAGPTPDEFVFTSFAEGIHTIAEFNPVQDMIELSKAAFPAFADVQAATAAVPGGAVINLDHNSSLLLPGVDPTSLHASNFALA